MSPLKVEMKMSNRERVQLTVLSKKGPGGKLSERGEYFYLTKEGNILIKIKPIIHKNQSRLQKPLISSFPHIKLSKKKLKTYPK